MNKEDGTYVKMKRNRQNLQDVNEPGVAQRNTTRRSMNFEKYVAQANHFINQVADELDIDRNMAARITRAVLHAVRDRIRPDDAIEFAQGLPTLLRGIFFEQYDPSRTPVPIRHPKDFIDYVSFKDGHSAEKDFPSPDFVEDGIAAVFRVLERNMDYGQVEQVKHMMNDEIAYLFY
jgi:uncharacterized protein (DUF2267 family)